MMQESSMCGGMWKVRYNVTEVSSISAFADRRGGAGGDYKEVYFVRMLGHPTEAVYIEEIRKMDRLLSKQAAEGQLRYQRVSGLPRLSAPEDVSMYSGCYDLWTGNSRRTLGLKAAEQDEERKAVLGYACGEALRLFKQLTPQATASMEKNFAVKLMFWADQVGQELLQGSWKDQSRKLVLQDVTKKQEYLFAFFMTLLGVDVLLLQYQSDIGADLERLNLSKKTVLGAFASLSIPAYEPYVPAPAVPAHTARRQNPGTAASRDRRPLQVRKAGEPGRISSGAGTASRTGAAPAAGRPVRPAPGTGSPVQTSGSLARRELDFEELARLASSVVMISVHDRGGKTLGNGSGIMIGEEGYILTNHHVATGGRFYSVRIEDDEKDYRTDEIIKYNSVLDLAVIRIDRRLRPLPIYSGVRKLVRGQKVVAIGSPLGLFNSVSDGIISGFRVINDVDMIQFTAPISHGSSGGAVLNMYGEVIGISTAGFDNGQNINLAVGYEFISQFVRGFTGQHGK